MQRGVVWPQSIQRWMHLCERDVLDQSVEISTQSVSEKDPEQLLLYCGKYFPPREEQLFYDVILELFELRYPSVILALCDHEFCQEYQTRFQHLILEGAASMLAEDLERAEQCYLKSHQLRAEEPAPYVNLVQIYILQAQYDVARKWLSQGFRRFPQHASLWEYKYILFMQSSSQDKQRDECVEHIRLCALKQNSWMGFVLYYELLMENQVEEDQLDLQHQKTTKLAYFFAQGERDIHFLTEYIGALGESEQYSKISSVIWQIKEAGVALPWKIELQHAQALMAQKELSAAKVILNKLEAQDNIPSHVREYLNDLMMQLTD